MVGVVVRLVPVALALALLVVLGVGSATAARSETGATSARAFAIQVAVPGQAGGSAASVLGTMRTIPTVLFACP